MTFLTTDHGRINLALATRIIVGAADGPWAKVPVSIDMVDGSSVHTSCYQHPLDEATALAADAVVPSQPGFSVLVWRGPDWALEEHPVLAWTISASGMPSAVSFAEDTAEARCAFRYPDGRVNDMHEIFASVAEWVASLGSEREEAAAA